MVIPGTYMWRWVMPRRARVLGAKDDVRADCGVRIVMAVTETRVSRAHDTLASGNFRDKVVLPRWKVKNLGKGDGIQ